MKKVWIGIIVLLIIGVIIVIRFQKPDTPVEELPETVILKPVEVTKAKRGEIRSELELSGTIEAEAQVSVFPKISGRIISLSIDEGNRVKKGDVLATIEHEELELAVQQAEATLEAAESAYNQTKLLAEVRVRAQIAQAQAQFDAATSSLQQVEDLSEIRAVTQIEQAEAGLDALVANLQKIKSGARSEDRQQARAALNQAEANLENAKRNYARMEKLFQNGAISEQSLESTKTQLDISKAQHKIASEQLQLIDNGSRIEDIQAVEAQVEQASAALRLAQAQAATRTWEKDIALAEAQVETARAALTSARALENAKSWEGEITTARTTRTQAHVALKLAQKRLRDATITAPITGVVSQRYLELGSMAAPTAPIFEIVDIETLKTTVEVIEAQLSQLSVDQSASVEIDGISAPLSSRVAFISPTIQPTRRTATVEFQIENPDSRLKPGMFAKVTVPIKVNADAILISRSALIENSDAQRRGARSVFVIENGMSQRRAVQIGLLKEGLAEILSGLAEGEAVVTAGQHSLKDGENVTVVNP